MKCGGTKNEGSAASGARGGEQCFQPPLLLLRLLLLLLMLLAAGCCRCSVAPFPPASPRHRARVPARCSPICSRNTEHRQSPRTHVVVAQPGIVRTTLRRSLRTGGACVRDVSLSGAPGIPEPWKNPASKSFIVLSCLFQSLIQASFIQYPCIVSC